MRARPIKTFTAVTGLVVLLFAAGACESDAPFANDADPCLDAYLCPATPRCAPTCETSLAEFQSFHDECEADYVSAVSRYESQPGDCRTAFYDCDGLHAFVLSYAYDNVQCYYGDAGRLVGAIRTSDHGHPLEAGQVPRVNCDMQPRCDAPDAGG